MNKRVLKKISTPFYKANPSAVILLINSLDPQMSTMKVFLEAIIEEHLPYITIANKNDLSDKYNGKILQKFPNTILASIKTQKGLKEIKERINKFPKKSRIIVLGVFNSGKTSLINKLTGKDFKVSNLPGTTLKFAECKYKDYVLIDTVGQVIDINKPMMVSIDLSNCETTKEKIKEILHQDALGILATMETVIPSIEQVVKLLKKRIKKGNKIIVTGAGASGLVAMEMAGQGLETGAPIIILTNNLADSYPISFSKGTGEEEGGLSRYASFVINKGDVVIGISASGGTGFVYKTLEWAKKKKAFTVAITENPDSPLGVFADYIIKSNAKPEGASSSKIQVAHLAIVHAILLTLASERGITADQSVKFMLSEKVDTKKMGIK